MPAGTRSHSEEHLPMDVSLAIQEEQRTRQAQIDSLRNDMLSQNKILSQQFLAARDHTQDQQDELRREMRSYMESIQRSLDLQTSRLQKQPDICTSQSSAGILGVSPPLEPAIQVELSDFICLYGEIMMQMRRIFGRPKLGDTSMRTWWNVHRRLSTCRASSPLPLAIAMHI
ncbi:hypothetical protein KSP39_PZI023594 [Platanthera zijinensis]|uniref:Uncharacterized protein n=1 Tax=Platanthera zijinensis TaxID=2320716 RepID=A0AAP0AS47_9ASPA